MTAVVDCEFCSFDAQQSLRMAKTDAVWAKLLGLSEKETEAIVRAPVLVRMHSALEYVVLVHY